jgi:hypothetical protein
VTTLEWVAQAYGEPKRIRVGISKGLDLWLGGMPLNWASRRPGSRHIMRSLGAETGRSSLTALNAYLAVACQKMEDWRRDYNGQRPMEANRGQMPD